MREDPCTARAGSFTRPVLSAVMRARTLRPRRSSLCTCYFGTAGIGARVFRQHARRHAGRDAGRERQAERHTEAQRAETRWGCAGEPSPHRAGRTRGDAVQGYALRSDGELHLRRP